MRISMTVLAGLSALVMGAGGAVADGHERAGPKVYPYKAAHNFCPAGLQPVTISGTICCGVPTTDTSYQHALMNAAPKKKVHRVRAQSPSCPVGAKGCSFN